jgi:hypothetical protein
MGIHRYHFSEWRPAETALATKPRLSRVYTCEISCRLADNQIRKLRQRAEMLRRAV